MNTLIKIVLIIILMAGKSQAQIMNAGVSGNSTSNLLRRLEKDVLKHQPDLVILMVGTNDMLNSKKMISDEEYEVQLGEITSKLKKEGIEVLMISPPPVDSAYLFERHDRLLYKESPNKIMGKVSQIVRKVAAENDALFLDLFEKFTALNLPKHNEDLFIRNPKNSDKRDGVHPTTLGYQFIAENVFQFLKKEKLLQEKKIICLGDSITYGAGSMGGGTITGQNYPSFLANKMSEFFRKLKVE